ncbi:DoxX family protein [Leptospira wolffii]|uniref:DoxX family protein n=1 Tax=Leptospira wolffii TaxID=409998 RepID=A0A2M9ZAE9_9LEPT|nr:DoxX family membrane protein [Leptospira wolffii]PJZ65374.1 DoxX family protein [Leptospira wolffii]
MKLLDISLRSALALVFVLFGASKFYSFMPTPPMMPQAANFMGAIVASGYLWQLVGTLEILGGLLLLSDRSVNLGLLLLGPIIANIVPYLLVLQSGVGVPPIAMSIFLLAAFGTLVIRRRRSWLRLITGE